jgi:hypothetical protein
MKLKTSHHYIDVFGSRIARNNLWFSHDIESDKKSQDVLKNRARRHHERKIHAAQEYFDACRTYFSTQVKWEWDLVQGIDQFFRNWMTNHEQEQNTEDEKSEANQAPEWLLPGSRSEGRGELRKETSRDERFSSCRGLGMMCLWLCLSWIIEGAPSFCILDPWLHS